MSSAILNKGMMKMIKNIIGPDQLSEAINGILSMADSFIESVQITEGETAAIIFYTVRNEKMFAVAVFNSYDIPVRFEKVQPVTELIKQILKSF